MNRLWTLHASSPHKYVSLNRPANESGVAHGRVARLFKKRFFWFKKCVCSFSKIKARNPENFEVLPAAGSFVGHKRKFVVVSRYIPLNYVVQLLLPPFSQFVLPQKVVKASLFVTSHWPFPYLLTRTNSKHANNQHY